MRRRVGSHFAPRRRVWNLPPEGFRELRRCCLLSRSGCAKLLGCSLSTVRAWDRGTHRVPWSAVKLLRLFRLGDVGALLPEWRGWSVSRRGLVSPEGYTYRLADLNWWGLTCREAEAWRIGRQRQRGRGTAVVEPPKALETKPGASGELPSTPTRQPTASPAERFCNRSGVRGRDCERGGASVPEGERARHGRAADGTGLVSFQKQRTRGKGKASKNAACRGGAPWA